MEWINWLILPLKAKRPMWVKVPVPAAPFSYLGKQHRMPQGFRIMHLCGRTVVGSGSKNNILEKLAIKINIFKMFMFPLYGSFSAITFPWYTNQYLTAAMCKSKSPKRPIKRKIVAYFLKIKLKCICEQCEYTGNWSGYLMLYHL